MYFSLLYCVSRDRFNLCLKNLTHFDSGSELVVVFSNKVRIFDYWVPSIISPYRVRS